MSNAESSPTALHIHQLKLVRGDKCLFSNLQLTISQGEVVACVGNNGSGKTSLGLAICKLIKISDGSITTTGQVAYCPQDPRFPLDLECQDYLEQLAALSGVAHRQQRNCAQEALELFVLNQYANKKIRTLSRGWQQRLNLARTWLNQPQLVILDEPHTALDPDGLALLGRALAAPNINGLILAPPLAPSLEFAQRHFNLEELCTG